MQVTRRRRGVGKESPGLLGRRVGRRTMVTACVTAGALVAAGTAIAQTHQFGTAQVGETTAQGQVVSSNQYIAPYGERLVVNNGKIMSSSVSPDGTHLAASVADGGAALAIMDLKNWKVQQVVGNSASSTPRISSNDVGQEGPTYSPDGSQLWLGQNNGYARFTVNPDGSVTNPTYIKIPADGPKRALVGEAVFSADGSTVYSALNGQNRVVAIDAATGAVTQSWAVGNAPRDMLMIGSKLYVSNEGGRPAKPGDTTINSYNTQVPADPVTAATTTGTVSVIDLANPGAAAGSIDVGLHPTALYAKDGALFVTNTATNDVSVIDTRKNKVVQTIATQPWPEASVGYEPDAVTLTDDGRLLVTLGRANAVAVYRYTSPQEPVSYVGLLPTDYFPAEIATVGKEIVVSNTRGIDARRPNNPAGRGTHDTTSSLQRFTLPSDRDIKAETAKVFKQNGWNSGSVKLSKGKDNTKPMPVPLRIGDPSTIKHVFMIVKENRTYDQVFGDVPEGNGDPSLAEFGENVTPNQHALARQFGLYDNTYDIGTNAAEGHTWLMQSDDPEYTESSAGEYTRSYDTEDDALGHQSTGFLWTGAQAAGQTVKNWGEFDSFESKPAGATWQNLYCDARTMAASGNPSKYTIGSASAIPSLNAVTQQGWPPFDTS
ncbi:MAG: phosphoesterase, partial [Streptomyces sp.]|nr:phosphoesterase [Streptomyces sp.]